MKQRSARACKNKKVVIGGTALELGDRFSVPNGGIVSGPVLQTLAAELIRGGSARCTGRPLPPR